MRTERYVEQEKRLPKNGKQVIGYQDGENITVYQAFNPQIAAFAITHQKFGGDHYSFTRMSWIKPGFLWMMHRAGWAQKQDQEKILAITLPLDDFKTVLKQATISSYDGRLFVSRESWKQELKNTDVRLQWDPDHDPYGNKQERKAIQIGMKAGMLQKFCTEWILKIEDITEFVKAQHQHVANGQLEKLELPYEQPIFLNDPSLEKRIGITASI